MQHFIIYSFLVKNYMTTQKKMNYLKKMIEIFFFPIVYLHGTVQFQIPKDLYNKMSK